MFCHIPICVCLQAFIYMLQCGEMNAAVVTAERQSPSERHRRRVVLRNQHTSWRESVRLDNQAAAADSNNHLIRLQDGSWFLNFILTFSLMNYFLTKSTHSVTLKILKLLKKKKSLLLNQYWNIYSEVRYTYAHEQQDFLLFGFVCIF